MCSAGRRLPVAVDVANWMTWCRVCWTVAGLALALLIRPSQAQCPVGISPCEKIYRNDCGFDACNRRIARLLYDEEAFWFGNHYDIACDGADPADAEHGKCLEPELAETGRRQRSIAARLYAERPRALDTGRLESYIELKFVSSAGNYSGCGGTYARQLRAFDVFPDMQPIEPWLLRDAPTFNLTPRKDDTFYSILIVDAGYGYVQGYYVDYPDTRAIVPWKAPLNFINQTNPYVVLVFEQNAKDIFLDPRWTTTMKSDRLKQMFDIADFAADHQLGSPIAINWMPVGIDAFSVEQQKRAGVADNCIEFVKQALLDSQREFLPSDLSSLKSSMQVRFNPGLTTFTVCCNDYRYPKRLIKLNPLSRQLVEPIYLRDKPDTILVKPTSLRERQSGASTFYDGHYYTLAAVNADERNNAVATPFRPMANWLIVNAPGQRGRTRTIDFDLAHTVLSYSRPLPAPKSPSQTLYFLLFEQKEIMSEEAIGNISSTYADSSCGLAVHGRCLFRLKRFTDDFELKLRAISWVSFVNDPFVRFVLVKQGQAEWNVCAFLPGINGHAGNANMWMGRSG